MCTRKMVALKKKENIDATFSEKDSRRATIPIVISLVP